MISQDWANLFREFKVNVAVSLDGPAFIHDRQRVTRSGDGTHAKVMAGINLLREAEIPFGVIAVLTAFSLDYPNELFDFFVENGVRGVGFNMDEVEGENKSTTYSQNGWAIEKYKSFMKRFMQRIEDSPGALFVREFRELMPFFISSPAPTIINNTVIPYNILNFDARGNFSTFCPELVGNKNEKYADFVMGNILTDGLDQLTNNPVFVAVYDEIRRGVELCEKSCDYWEICRGGSPSAKYFEHGRFDATETLTCYVTRKTMADAILEHIEERTGLRT